MRCDPRPHHGLLEIRQRSGYPACRAGSEGARRQPLPRRADVLPVRRAGASVSEHGRRHDDRCDSRPRGRPHRGSANARRAGGPVTITMPNITVSIFIGYLAVLVAIGFVCERFTKGLEGFVLGDRKMGPWLTAVRFIREHADQPIRVGNVLEQVSVSRRSLEQRLFVEPGRSPAAEIRRVHLPRAMELLTRTELPIPAVASASGFLHPEVMIRAFRREVGVSPTAYRRQARTR